MKAEVVFQLLDAIPFSTAKVMQIAKPSYQFTCPNVSPPDYPQISGLYFALISARGPVVCEASPTKGDGPP
jgi:hypothetical protein